MKVRENRILKAMREGRKAYGYNLMFPSPWVVEVLGYEDFDFVAAGARQDVRLRHVLSSAFAFGGNNVVLILSAPVQG